MKSVNGRIVRCWREYSWDPDCLGCWVWYCPCHLATNRGRGEQMMLEAIRHIRKHHPRQPVVVS